MTDPASSDPFIQPAMLDAVGDALSIAFLVYDKNDQITYASRNICSYFSVSPDFVAPGIRLREFLGALYDHTPDGGRNDDGQRTPGAREKWIAERISDHWRERSDIIERDAGNRLIKFAKRRLPSGYGICVVSDVTEQKKRDEQWRSDMERVQLTEEILDNLSVPVFVCDPNLSLVAVNKALCAELSTGPESLLDQKIASVFSGDLGAQLSAAARHVLETGCAAQTHWSGVFGTSRHVLRTQRVGKPGRYLLVTNVDAAEEGGADRLGMNATIPVEHGPAAPLAPASDIDAASVAAMLDGRKVLIVTRNLEFEAQCLLILARLGIEACSVRSEEEEQAFLGIADNVGIALDLVVVDTQMDMRCLEMAEGRGLRTLTLDGFDVASELAYRVAAVIVGIEDPALDDWEITTRETPERPRSTGRLQVLVAEDNEVNQIVFSQILDGLGYSYRIVSDGEEVVSEWERLRPGIVLMDLTLPGLNGLEAARCIRQLEGEGEETPIVGVLSLAVDQDELDCMAAGMNETILKPLSPDVILDVLQRHRLQLAADHAL